jgi:alkanesulfonate monooxygenase SsuD/methylene tetrahydromethanopterin reductase-like flavin-dependent oxidoreductase (luciferase family)
MDIGLILHLDPPARRTVELARRAEAAGFSHLWVWDSHLFWQEPYLLIDRILAATDQIVAGPMVTNPVTRDPSVLASMHATLQEEYGDRTICGIGRGSSAVYGAGLPAASTAELKEAVLAVRHLAEGRNARLHGTSLRLPWAGGTLPVWMSGYGPRTLRLVGEIGDGLILQLADEEVTEYSARVVHEAAVAAGRDPAAVKICVSAPAHVGRDATQGVSWISGMVYGHLSHLMSAYGDGGPLQTLGKLGQTDLVRRFCLLGPADEHLAKLRRFRDRGVDQVAIYAQHEGLEETLAAYESVILPEVRSWD